MTRSDYPVGNAFVQQYYHILHHSPGLVYRFYQDISKLGRPEEDGSMSITTTMQAINEKIVSLNYGDFRAEIKSVDTQESFSGGFHVLVTGYLTGKENTVRNFAQSFFLAPQDRGYFVLNDMFRYLNVNPALVNDVVAPITAEPIPAPVQENHVSEQSTPSAEEAVAGEVYNPSENGDVPIVEEEVPIAEVVDEVQDDEQIVVESNVKIEEVPRSFIESNVKIEEVPRSFIESNVKIEEVPRSFIESNAKIEEAPQNFVESSAKIEEVPKKSYASIVMHLKETAASFSPPPAAPRRKAPPKNVEQPNPTFASMTDGPVSSSESVDNGNNQDADGYSIYVKGLPMNATDTALEEVFKKFGTIKSDGIQVRSNRQQMFCFGFVEFEEASSVQKALEASPVIIGGRQAVVEEKRGRFQPGRGSGFRNDGARGRGNYGGGRGGYNRGDFNGRSDFANRGGNRGGPTNRDAYQKSENVNSNGARTNRAGGMANGSAKNVTPRVSATA
ncbi:hypothetical protein BUALT_Bualt02G0003600 [Buddleja alternifolia]|uniref:G3BP-like protein n=1 Tax=Buddleja alternifolia TaxID=168488 RepID=A0AAV6Y2R2_9LAMI|nr:hypothetical protein BUALT_Bualt02G0003600 [Buddleja alternifolia]